jgi:uncharacterized membrane protein YbaN (DUF454 family)
MAADLREASDEGRPEVRKHSSMTVRVLLVIAGTLCLVLAVVGVFTPVLPTTPFVLLAAACYARASNRFHRMLLDNRTFGPIIREWERHRSIPRRVKAVAIGMMATTLSISVIFFVEPAWLKGALVALGFVLGFWMYRIPSRDAATGARASRSGPG